MKWAKLHGYNYLYFYEVESKYTSSEFKIGFGGNMIMLPKAFIYIHNSFLRWIYTITFSRIYSDLNGKSFIMKKIIIIFKKYLNKLQ